MVGLVTEVMCHQVEPVSTRRKRSAGKEEGRRVCSLALVADHIFHKVGL